MNGVDTEAIAACVTACPSVVELSGGPTGSVATYLPGRRVVGVRARGPSVAIHVVGRWEVPVPKLTDEVRSAIAGLVNGHAVEVVVEDLVDGVVATDSGARA